VDAKDETFKTRVLGIVIKTTHIIELLLYFKEVFTMYKSLFGILGFTFVVYGSYKLGYKVSEAQHAKDVEKGVQIGFKTAPSIYRKMVENGDMETVPEGMYRGEIGKVFKTEDEAKLLRAKHVLDKGFSGEIILKIKGDEHFKDCYVLLNFDDIERKV
jgi:hypothetical protein